MVQTLNLRSLSNIAEETLKQLVTETGIYASTAEGQEGLFHGYFGRDTAITAHLVTEAEHLVGRQNLTPLAVQGLLNLQKWQGKKNDPDTGEEAGKFTHEVRTREIDYQHLTVGMLKQNRRSWYVDPADQVLKNWDSNDATALWIITSARLWEKGKLEATRAYLHSVKEGLHWCFKNLQDHGGLAGFTETTARRWGGLYNQGWKDSELTYLHTDGTKPKHPIKDVWVNSLMWSAFKYGEKLFASVEPDFALLLKQKASELKLRFNDSQTGFLMTDAKSGFYYAEAIDGDGRQLMHPSCDPGLVLWAYFEDECIINQELVPSVVKRLMADDLYDKTAGIRVYSSDGAHYDPLGYHRGPHTFWPFVSALIAEGFDHFGFQKDATDILSATLAGVAQFGTCVELFLKRDGVFGRYADPVTGQSSCSSQAWTAAAVYYALNYIEKQTAREMLYA